MADKKKPEDMDNENMDNELEVISLVDENGKEEDFEFVGRVDYNGGVYIALVPVKSSESGEYVLLKLVQDENGEESLVTIDDDDEFDAVADKFEDELFENIDYDD